MSSYAKMLCESGLPGTENPLLCPDPPKPPLRSPIFKETEVNPFKVTTPSSQLFFTQPFVEVTQLQPAIPLRQIRTQKRMSRQPVPYWSDNRLILTTAPSVKRDMKKVYLIPWSSKRESRVKPIVDFLLIPDDVLQPDAPLDTLKSDAYDIHDSDNHHIEHKYERRRKRKHQRKRLRIRKPKNYITTESDEKYEYRHVTKPAFHFDDDPYETS